MKALTLRSGCRIGSCPLTGLVTPETLLRWSLGIVYLWFGALKLANMSPILAFIQRAFPRLGAPPLYLGLALFEMTLGAMLLSGIWKRWTAAAVVFHLIGTMSVVVTAPGMVFLPRFPFLTVDGEFVAKNLVLMAAAGALWLGAATEPRPDLPRLKLLLPSLVVVAGLGFAGARLQRLTGLEAVRSAPSGALPFRLTAGQVEALTRGGKASTIMLQGKVTDRCGLLGCWLKLGDAMGSIFIDLASSGFDARGIPLGGRVRVAGHIGETRAGRVGFIAASIQPLPPDPGKR